MIKISTLVFHEILPVNLYVCKHIKSFGLHSCIQMRRIRPPPHDCKSFDNQQRFSEQRAPPKINQMTSQSIETASAFTNYSKLLIVEVNNIICLSLEGYELVVQFLELNTTYYIPKEIHVLMYLKQDISLIIKDFIICKQKKISLFILYYFVDCIPRAEPFSNANYQS